MIYDCFAWVGFACIAAGAWTIHPACGLITAGGGLVALAVGARIVADRERQKKKREQ